MLTVDAGKGANGVCHVIRAVGKGVTAGGEHLRLWGMFGCGVSGGIDCGDGSSGVSCCSGAHPPTHLEVLEGQLCLAVKLLSVGVQLVDSSICGNHVVHINVGGVGQGGEDLNVKGGQVHTRSGRAGRVGWLRRRG